MRLKNATEYAVFELADVTVYITTNGRTVAQEVYRTAGLVKIRATRSGRLPELYARALYTELFAEYLGAGSVVTVGPRQMEPLA